MLCTALTQGLTSQSRVANRCAEKLILGEGNVTTAGASDLEHVNSIAREMIYRCGFSKRLGPVALMDNEEVYINKEQSRSIANIGTELAAIALTEVEEVQLLPPLACPDAGLLHERLAAPETGRPGPASTLQGAALHCSLPGVHHLA